MTTELIKEICEFRLLIGLLGEKHQGAWWDCSFLSSSSTAFLAPIYPNSIPIAQYYGVCQAAAMVHDEHIGIGRHYHLYRLPDSIERMLSKRLQDKEFSLKANKYLTDRETAINRLKDLGAVEIDRAEGPVAVGDFSDTTLYNLLEKSLSYYLTAFESGFKTFPYMRCL